MSIVSAVTPLGVIKDLCCCCILHITWTNFSTLPGNFDKEETCINNLIIENL